MMKIDWDEFKVYKQHHLNSRGRDNFTLLYEFVKSYYNFSSYYDIYDLLSHDELSLMMLHKRNINSAEDLERYFR
jgi:hypothetical protein